MKLPFFETLSCVLFSSALLLGANADECAVNDSDKIDCAYSGITQSQCEAKGCCWAEASSGSIPWCYYKAGASSTCYGYNVTFE